ADLVPGLDGIRDIPRVGSVRKNLAAQEGLDATLLEQRHLLSVAQFGVGLVLDHGRPATDLNLEQPAERVDRHALPVYLPDDRRCVVGTLDGLPERLDLLRRVR